MKKQRDQINILVDAEVREAIDLIRSLRRPVPSISEAIREAVLNEAARLSAKSARQK